MVGILISAIAAIKTSAVSQATPNSNPAPRSITITAILRKTIKNVLLGFLPTIYCKLKRKHGKYRLNVRYQYYYNRILCFILRHFNSTGDKK